ncbi:MAG: cytochrome P450 [Gammaproteobacteria bacterium]|nr:cytochrome P450 [Gammaproteobacteria bacterium]
MLDLSPDTNLLDPHLIPSNSGPPHQLFDAWRESDPIHWNPPSESYSPPNPATFVSKGFYVLTRHADVREVSLDQERFSSHDGGPTIWDFEGEQLMRQRAGLMGMRPDDHTATKALVGPPFGAKELSSFYPEVQQVAEEIVDSVAKRGKCEFAFDVASKLPVYTFCKLLGVADAMREQVFTLGNMLADIEKRDDAHGEDYAGPELMRIGNELAQEKLESPDNSAMSRLVHGEVEGRKLDAAGLGMFFVTLAIAGHETTRNTATHFLRLMSEHPDQYALLRSDLDKYLPNAIEEVLRHSPPVIKFRRTVTRDTEVGGHQFRKGDKIYLSYAAANHDPAVFDDPHTFDITRRNARKHLAFGVGPHFCMGAALARYQLRALLTQWITRLPDYSIDGEMEMLPSIWFNAVVKMPLRFTPEAA